MHKSIWDISQEWWKTVTLKVKNAIVFMDSNMAELLHWSGGIEHLLSADVVDIREFSSFEAAGESYKKGVFIVSSALTDVTSEILCDIISHSHFQYVLIFTTTSPLLHSSSGESDSDTVFEEMEEKVLEWLGNMNYTVEISHIPMFAAEVCPGMFITPTFSKLFPIMASDVKQIVYQYRSSHHLKDTKQIERLKDIEFIHLPNSLQKQIKMFASGLHAMLQCLDVREDVYSIGHMSHLVATELDVYPPARARRKSVQNRASLVLIDRTLDVASAVTYQVDSLLDKMMNTLSQLPGHSSDRTVNLQCLSHVCSSSLPVLLPGSLAPTHCLAQPTHLIPLVMKKQKEAIMDVNRKLVETASAEKLPLNLAGRPGRVTAEQIESTVTLFKGKYSLIKKHLDLLQTSLATSQCMKHPSAGQHDMMVMTEKNLMQTIADNDESAPSATAILSKLMLQEMQKSRMDEKALTLDDMLCLITYMYSIMEESDEDENEETLLREKFIEWILQESENLSPLVKQIVGEKVTNSIVTDQIENVWQRLEDIRTVRDELQHFRSVLDPGDAMTPTSVKSLLRLVIEKIVDPAKPDLPDIECKSGGFKDLLKSGFGFFKSSGKPRPGDSPLLILFVIGGLTASEVKQIRDVIDKAKPSFEVLIGSTRLSSISSCLESIFISDNVNTFDQ
ncbi:sec1 family domain-containing protein 2 [Biomphalaria glabrata]|nr:sec1 family domain-containing protein 2 [Biomphalaria glabrata]